MTSDKLNKLPSAVSEKLLDSTTDNTTLSIELSITDNQGTTTTTTLNINIEI